MLVLSRKIGQSIVIDGEVTLIVNRIDGNRVSIAIDAPRQVSVVRGELKPFADGFGDSGGGDASAADAEMPRPLTRFEARRNKLAAR